jgi:hypothetical protein
MCGLAFRRNFCPPIGPSPRAATVAIWPHRPQNRFRYASAYCRLPPAPGTSTENSIPPLIRLTQIFSQRGKRTSTVTFWPSPARQRFCSPRPARPCGLMNTSRFLASPWLAWKAVRAPSPRRANSSPTMAVMRPARLSFRRRSAVFITSFRGIRRSNMASESAAPGSNGAAQGGLR